MASVFHLVDWRILGLRLATMLDPSGTDADMAQLGLDLGNVGFMFLVAIGEGVCMATTTLWPLVKSYLQF